MIIAPRDVEFLHFHLFCGLGGGAKGFNAGRAEVGHTRARYRCIGGVDADAAAIADFGRLAGVPGTVLDLFTREQYVAFHGHEPRVAGERLSPTIYAWQHMVNALTSFSAVHRARALAAC